MSYENHRATRAVVDYAATHRRAVVMEKLSLGLAQRLFALLRFRDEFALRKLMVPPWHGKDRTRDRPPGRARS